MMLHLIRGSKFLGRGNKLKIQEKLMFAVSNKITDIWSCINLSLHGIFFFA